MAVCIVIFRLAADGGLEVLLCKYSDKWVLPGGLCDVNKPILRNLVESVNALAGCNLCEKLNYIEQLYTFDSSTGATGNINITYMGCINSDINVETEALAWRRVDKLPTMVEGQANFVAYARQRLVAKIAYTNVMVSLLDPDFTLTRAQIGYEAVVGRKFDKRNFRKKIISLGFIEETGDLWRSGAHRPAKLYRFKSKKHKALSVNFC